MGRNCRILPYNYNTHESKSFILLSWIIPHSHLVLCRERALVVSLFIITLKFLWLYPLIFSFLLDLWETCPNRKYQTLVTARISKVTDFIVWNICCYFSIIGAHYETNRFQISTYCWVPRMVHIIRGTSLYYVL